MTRNSLHRVAVGAAGQHPDAASENSDFARAEAQLVSLKSALSDASALLVVLIGHIGDGRDGEAHPESTVLAMTDDLLAQASSHASDAQLYIHRIQTSAAPVRALSPVN